MITLPVEHEAAPTGSAEAHSITVTGVAISQAYLSWTFFRSLCVVVISAKSRSCELTACLVASS